MPATILSGKDVAAALLDSLKPKVKELQPHMAIVQVGDDPASDSYITQKRKSCEEVGITSIHRHLAEKTTKEELLRVVDELNRDTTVTGFIVQLPLPAHLKSAVEEVIRAIDPAKDIDGFTPVNVGKTFLGTAFEDLPPATPAGVILLLEHYGIDVRGKHAVVVGHSNITGKPLAAMLLNRNATVTVCHKYTADLAQFTGQADILCTAVGKPGLITGDMVKPGAVVIDIGTTRTDAGLKGDVDFDAVKEIASAITPVPGGIGPMTVASLIRNCVRAAEMGRG
ncbi:MAG: bifunctional 5,10-methylenetetrahydrofolate dehydrogenase/5,10-methenyltetrahydrofolate cyclohydrolase [Candidatus Peribacteraceae bacterium]|jgi:methylenetetrahydrofolate dehydrogenase (NADP+)/methenyltetrahydrofolate cyclohydrolase